MVSIVVVVVVFVVVVVVVAVIVAVVAACFVRNVDKPQAYCFGVHLQVGQPVTQIAVLFTCN